MEVSGACRCCLTVGLHRDLNSSYTFLGKKEVYSEMLLECFNIVILTQSDDQGNTICNTCIKSLRASCEFRQQIINSEEVLLRSITKNEESILNTEVKMEPKYDTDDSDDNFLADEVYKEPKSIKKAEKSHNELLKKKKESWKSGTIKSLVNTLANSIAREIPSPINKRAQKNVTAMEETASSRQLDSQKKHNENFQTVLKYTNATPFRTKSLLGYICFYCQEAYPDPANLRHHVAVDHKKERLNYTCGDRSNFYVNLDITNLTCTLCDERFDNLTAVKTHLVNIHNKVIHKNVKDVLFQFKLKPGDVYDCASCTSTYETFKMLKQHMNKHYPNYVCKKCDTSFATRRSLSSHNTTHQNGSYKCDQCDKVFSSMSKKHYHFKTMHLGTRNISNCPYCDEPFRSYYQRNQHLIKMHNAESKYKCNVCPRTFLLKSILTTHIKKKHLMERNAQCSECGYRFFSKKDLKVHMVKHTGERNHSCNVCHKSFGRKCTLREHMRIHNNDRRFKCDVCAMSFVQKCSLRSHLLSNHGISLAASEINCSNDTT